MSLPSNFNCAHCSVAVAHKNTTDSRLCSDCAFWNHVSKVTEDSLVSNKSGSCIYCIKLNEKAEKKEYSYEIPNDANSDPQDDSDVDIDPNGDFPVGSPSTYKYFINFLAVNKTLNIKLGDCVYYAKNVSSPKRTQNINILRVQFMIKDVSGKAWMSGYRIIRESEAKVRGRKRKSSLGNDVMATIHGDVLSVINENIMVPLDSVTGLCCVLQLSDYEFGKPRYIPKEDVLSVGNQFDIVTRTIGLQTKADFKTCLNPLMWQSYDDELEEEHNIKFKVVFNDEHKSFASPSILSASGSKPKTPKRSRVSFAKMSQLNLDSPKAESKQTPIMSTRKRIKILGPFDLS